MPHLKKNEDAGKVLTRSTSAPKSACAKRRGRPPKVIVPAPEPAEPVPRKRGAGRIKRAISTPAATETVKKRPGRPAKIQPAQRSVSTGDAEPVLVRTETAADEPIKKKRKYVRKIKLPEPAPKQRLSLNREVAKVAIKGRPKKRARGRPPGKAVTLLAPSDYLLPCTDALTSQSQGEGAAAVPQPEAEEPKAAATIMLHEPPLEVKLTKHRLATSSATVQAMKALAAKLRQDLSRCDDEIKNEEQRPSQGASTQDLGAVFFLPFLAKQQYIWSDVAVPTKLPSEAPPVTADIFASGLLSRSSCTALGAAPF